MPKINSVQTAKEAFPELTWRDLPSKRGRMAFAIMSKKNEAGDIIILLAMEDGAIAPLHRHKPRQGWPFRESITVLAGNLFSVDPSDGQFFLPAGTSVDLIDDLPHAPVVNPMEFALVIYRQPAGMELVEPQPS